MLILIVLAAPPACVNKLDDCPRFGQNACTNFKPWAMDNCRYYCRFCTRKFQSFYARLSYSHHARLTGSLSLFAPHVIYATMPKCVSFEICKISNYNCQYDVPSSIYQYIKRSNVSMNFANFFSAILALLLKLALYLVDIGMIYKVSLEENDLIINRLIKAGRLYFNISLCIKTF